MLFGIWSWILVILIIGAAFYANKLPELRKQAEKKFQEGKVLYEKSRKEFETKATVLKEKHQAIQQKIKEKNKEKKTLDVEDDEKEITIDDLAFMPEQQNKNKETEKK
ncbi:MAG: hypothetical protein IJ660_06910 [Alphaproteobacteria bacterium]|nr:hypothetical protein [Alphaproteobacteria bacterium]